MPKTLWLFVFPGLPIAVLYLLYMVSPRGKSARSWNGKVREAKIGLEERRVAAALAAEKKPLSPEDAVGTRNQADNSRSAVNTGRKRFSRSQLALIATLLLVVVSVGALKATGKKDGGGEHNMKVSTVDSLIATTSKVAVIESHQPSFEAEFKLAPRDNTSPEDILQRVSHTFHVEPLSLDEENPKGSDRVLVRAEYAPSAKPVPEEVRKLTPVRTIRETREVERPSVKTKPVPKTTLASKPSIKDPYAVCPGKYAGQYVEVQTVRVPARTKEDIVVPRSGIRWVFPVREVGIVESLDTIYFKTDKVYKPLSKLPTSAFRFIRSYDKSPTAMVVCAVRDGN